MLHFYFGDRRGSPGSMITFFVHEAEPPGLCGPGHISSIAFAVPFGTLQSWRHQLMERGADVTATPGRSERSVCASGIRMVSNWLLSRKPPKQARMIKTGKSQRIEQFGGFDPSRFKSKGFSTRRNF